MKERVCVEGCHIAMHTRDAFDEWRDDISSRSVGEVRCGCDIRGLADGVGAGVRVRGCGVAGHDGVGVVLAHGGATRLAVVGERGHTKGPLGHDD